MTRQIGKLSAISLPRIKAPGMHSDGGGLYLRVKPDGGKFWAFRYMLHGRAREMGLGAFQDVPLAKARDKAGDRRKQLAAGHDPIEARDAVKAQKRLDSARSQTFRQCAEAYVEAHKAGWRNEKHAKQWPSTLARYAYPKFGEIPVQDVDLNLVMKALEPIWKTKSETAQRLRGRIEAVLDWATVRQYRSGENPARWRGHLDKLLSRPSKARTVKHHPALPYAKIGQFMEDLMDEEGDAAEALALTILTTARTGETIGASWPEIDFQKKVWTVPADRIKGGREHRVPLSEPTQRLLTDRKKRQEKRTGKPVEGWIFPGQNPIKPLSNMAMLVLLARMGRDDITVHGFRSSFRDWAAEQTNFPREIAEAALAHVSGDRVEASYLRTDHFEKRRQLMNAWARHCAQPAVKKTSGKVVSLRGRQ